jgi:hypothetical protein
MKTLLMTCLVSFGLAHAADTQVELGKELFLTAGGYGCHVCHGLVANGAGQAGGAIRGASLEALENSLLTNPPMQPLNTVLGKAQKHAIIAYLQSLSQYPLLEFNFINEKWILKAEEFKVGQTLEMIFYNGSFDVQQLDLKTLGLEVISFEPLATSTLRWQADRNAIDLDHVELSLPVSE